VHSILTLNQHDSPLTYSKNQDGEKINCNSDQSCKIPPLDGSSIDVIGKTQRETGLRM